MIDPKDTDIGRAVTYIGGGKPEHGTITSWNDTVVFVCYDGDSHSKATSRQDLEWCALPTMDGRA